MANSEFVFNGLDGETGAYLLPPMRPEQLAELARREPRYLFSPERDNGSDPVPKGLAEGIDPFKLAEAGWGVIFPERTDPEVRKALSELLEHRKRLAGECYREFKNGEGYRPGESKGEFLARYGVGSGPVNPDRMPYYLLLVGDLEEIPCDFQYQLDVQYAVGRIHFQTVREYEEYAQSVVKAETGQVRPRNKLAFFGPSNPGDISTELSSTLLVGPLAASLERRQPGRIVRALGVDATKERLGRLMGGSETPALLFTAGHGVAFRSGNNRQAERQGALVCQDWPGPGSALQEGHYFAAADVGQDADVAGAVMFHFACYSAGTPHIDDFIPGEGGQGREIAPSAFLASLPRRLLAHPRGGALAVIGHIDRAWGWSFSDPRLERQREVFESALRRLVGGCPVGHALEYFNVCYAELSTDLDTEIRKSTGGRDQRLSQLWACRNDARNYALLGDPAVRLTIGVMEAGKQ